MFRENIMVSFFVICCFVNVITCFNITSSSDNNTQYDIIYYDHNSDGKGNYNFSFKSPNIEREESGQVVNVGQPNQYIRVTGKYSYTEITDEETIQLKTVYYSADKDGYRIDRTEIKETPIFQQRFENLT